MYNIVTGIEFWLVSLMINLIIVELLKSKPMKILDK